MSCFFSLALVLTLSLQAQETKEFEKALEETSENFQKTLTKEFFLNRKGPYKNGYIQALREKIQNKKKPGKQLIAKIAEFCTEWLKNENTTSDIEAIKSFAKKCQQVEQLCDSWTTFEMIKRIATKYLSPDPKNYPMADLIEKLRGQGYPPLQASLDDISSAALEKKTVKKFFTKRTLLKNSNSKERVSAARYILESVIPIGEIPPSEFVNSKIENEFIAQLNKLSLQDLQAFFCEGGEKEPALSSFSLLENYFIGDESNSYRLGELLLKLPLETQKYLVATNSLRGHNLQQKTLFPKLPENPYQFCDFCDVQITCDSGQEAINQPSDLHKRITRSLDFFSDRAECNHFCGKAIRKITSNPSNLITTINKLCSNQAALAGISACIKDTLKVDKYHPSAQQDTHKIYPFIEILPKLHQNILTNIILDEELLYALLFHWRLYNGKITEREYRIEGVPLDHCESADFLLDLAKKVPGIGKEEIFKQLKKAEEKNTKNNLINQLNDKITKLKNKQKKPDKNMQDKIAKLKGKIAKLKNEKAQYTQNQSNSTTVQYNQNKTYQSQEPEDAYKEKYKRLKIELGIQKAADEQRAIKSETKFNEKSKNLFFAGAIIGSSTIGLLYYAVPKLRQMQLTKLSALPKTPTKIAMQQRAITNKI